MFAIATVLGRGWGVCEGRVLRLTLFLQRFIHLLAEDGGDLSLHECPGHVGAG